jgi:staphyloferrin B biosynthesis citrate synthase
MNPSHSFRRRLASREMLVGTFIKTPTTHTIEIIGGLGFDFVVIDQEHAPFDRASTDAALLAAKAVGLPALVRIQGVETILSVLDSGAAGILVPHVVTIDDARKVAAASRYEGKRGFATSTRAGRYSGLATWDHIDRADAETVVVAQIEDPEALENVGAIAKTDGIDALFIGRGDLTAAYKDRSPDPAPVREACERIATAARHADKPLSVFTGGAQEAEYLSGLGATVFILSSDQGFLRSGALQSLSALKTVLGGRG